MPQPKRPPPPRLETMAMADQSLVCDFCNAPTPAAKLTAFRCADFPRRVMVRDRIVLVETCSCHGPIDLRPTDRVIEQNVIGAWMACPRCRRAIAAGDRPRLARIAVESGHLEPPPVPSLLASPDDLAAHLPADPMALVAAQHLAFWLHREP